MSGLVAVHNLVPPRRITAPLHNKPEKSVIDGLFKIIEVLRDTNTTAVAETLHEETSRIADILRYIIENLFNFFVN